MRRANRAVVSGVAGATAISAVIAGLALASVPAHPTLRTAHNAGLNETIVVDAKGRTVYELRPETSRHLLCTSAQCLMFWPPVKVPAHGNLTKVAGIKGKLGRLHRKGFFQLTLGGHPLYRFSGDSAKGQAGGQGLQSFGGTWHVVRAAAKAGGTTTTTTTTTTSMTTSSYCYPGNPPVCY